MPANNTEHSVLKNIEQAVSTIKNELMIIGRDNTEIKERMMKLEAQFNQQFPPTVSNEDMDWIQQDITHQEGKFIYIFKMLSY